MEKKRSSMRMNPGVRICLLLLCGLCAIPAAAADTTITGTVRDLTTGLAAAGDDVLLLRLGQGMQEETRTRTDAQGAFTVNAGAADARYIIRVMHQGVNYDQMALGKNPLEIRVFDAVTKIPGMDGNMGIAQLESDGNSLKVAEMYSIRNASNPPVTQFGPRNFDFSLPAGASLDSLEAKSGDGLWVNVTPVPVQGQAGRFGMDFPLRPGDTLIKFKYHLPQQGATTLRLRLAYPIQRFAVVHPPSMSFRPSRRDAFRPSGITNGLQIEEAAARPVRGEVPSFAVSGAGIMPAPPSASAPPPPPPTVSAPPVAGDLHAPPSPAPSPVPPATRSWKETWAMISALAVVLALGLIVMSRMKRRKSAPAAAMPAPAAGGSPLDSLKDELFRLEADRLNGSISEAQYDSARKALNENIQRTMAAKNG